MAILENAEMLNEEELKNASGGYVYENPRTGLWNVIDVRTGKVVAAFKTEEEAQKLNKKNLYEMGNGTISDGIVEHLRNYYGLTEEEQFGEFY